MNNSIYRIGLDVQETSSPTMLNIKQNDNAREIHISLYEKGKKYTIGENCTATFRAKKPDGSVLFNSCEIDGNVIKYVITNQTTAAIGIVECEVTLYGEEATQLTSARFSMAVTDNLYDDSEVESKDEFSQLVSLMAQIFNMDCKVEQTTDGAIISVTNKDGETTEAEVFHGKGSKAPDVSVQFIEDEYTIVVTRYDDQGIGTTTHYPLEIIPYISSRQTTDGYDLTIGNKLYATTIPITNGKDGKDGIGVPVGGTTGQALAKKSDSDFDAEWVDVLASNVANNLTTTSDGYVLDARQGKALKDIIDDTLGALFDKGKVIDGTWITRVVTANTSTNVATLTLDPNKKYLVNLNCSWVESYEVPQFIELYADGENVANQGSLMLYGYNNLNYIAEGITSIVIKARFIASGGTCNLWYKSYLKAIEL